MEDMLKAISESDFNSIINIKINYDNFDENYKNYTSAILDVFDHTLSVEEAEALLNCFEEHNLKYEHRYVQFIKDVYRLNKDKPVVIETYLNEITSIGIIKILSILDFRDKLLFIDLIRGSHSDSHFFLVANEEILCLLTKLSTRELLFSTIHFIEIPITVVGNFDLSFPVLFNNKNDMERYLSIAKKNDLFFREVSRDK